MLLQNFLRTSGGTWLQQLHARNMLVVPHRTELRRLESNDFQTTYAEPAICLPSTNTAYASRLSTHSRVLYNRYTGPGHDKTDPLLCFIP